MFTISIQFINRGVISEGSGVWVCMSGVEKEYKPTPAEIIFIAVWIFTWVILAYIPLMLYNMGEIEVSAGLFIMLYINYLASLFNIIAVGILGLLSEAEDQ